MYSLEVFKAMYFAITLTHFWAPGFLNSRSPNFSKLRVSVRPNYLRNLYVNTGKMHHKSACISCYSCNFLDVQYSMDSIDKCLRNGQPRSDVIMYLLSKCR